MEKFSRIDTAKWHEHFYGSEPFDHLVIDNFFDANIADKLSDEFPEYESSTWHVYDNAIEHKKTCNNWNAFPSLTYSTFSYLNSTYFVENISNLLCRPAYADPGLHGGGWHLHGKGGKLNVHLDYDIHPKMKFQRKLNLIVYLNKKWNPEWGGGLELWSHDPETNAPKELVKTVENKFNRAVLFDTTQNSWHGLPENLTCPDGEYRKSLAVYYLQIPVVATDRQKALFAPNKEQADDESVMNLIRERSNINTFKNAYVKK
jgi:Rps23 Pro-64 3,4-dihydroxylase Tpa1-like proline 4-hydroxylase